MSLIIRQARMADAPLILQYIKDLAEYEKLLHEVMATEEDIRRTLFNQSPRAFVVLAEWDDQPAGFALYFYNYSTFLGQNGIYVEDIFVPEAMRGRGIGKALLAYLSAKAIKEKCGRVEWQVLDWNKPSIEFYESLGARSMDEWTVFRLEGSTLNRLADEA